MGHVDYLLIPVGASYSTHAGATQSKRFNILLAVVGDLTVTSQARVAPMQNTEALANPLVYATRAMIRWKDAAGQVQVRPVEAPCVVGSAPEAALCFTAPTVSRLHAELRPEPDGLWLRDLGSKNGSYVFGVRVERARVPDGATVSFGEFKAEVTYEKTVAAKGAPPVAGFGPLLGQSAAMQTCFALLAQAAAVDASVLITGETGVGKDIAANALHAASRRSEGRFVIVDCAALPENLLEAELFGHAKGAFTGAVGAREGAFEAAHGGTLFIDEVGEIPLSLQPKLLRMLEARAVRRLGETHYRNVDTRVIAATHRDLRSMVNQGTFREDLYFRLAVLPIHVPALRDRREDIPVLMTKFFKGATVPIEPAQMEAVCTRPWPGNVRELRNFVDRVMAVGVSRAMDLSFGDMTLAEEAGPVALSWTEAHPVGDPSVSETLDEYRSRAERTYLEALLQRHNYNISHAAKAAGVGRGHLYRLMHRWNL